MSSSCAANRAFTGLGGREEPLTRHEHLTPGTQLPPVLELSRLQDRKQVGAMEGLGRARKPNCIPALALRQHGPVLGNGWEAERTRRRPLKALFKKCSHDTDFDYFISYVKFWQT